jgi:hypothetical protein
MILSSAVGVKQKKKQKAAAVTVKTPEKPHPPAAAAKPQQQQEPVKSKKERREESRRKRKVSTAPAALSDPHSFFNRIWPRISLRITDPARILTRIRTQVQAY